MIYPKILFVTNRNDFATDYLILKLRNYDDNIPYLRINSEDIDKLSIKTDLIKSSIITVEDADYDISSLVSGYFRRAPSVFDKPLSDKDTNFINRERRHFLEGFYESLKIKWVNPIFSTYKAERKMYQLSLAKEVGFDIPKTIVTNSPQEIKTFIKNFTCIIKPISNGLIVNDKKIYSIYTSEIKENDINNYSDIYEMPLFIQQKIPKICDIRATVVGNKIFATGIKVHDNQNTDWRYENIKKEYFIHELPNKICNEIYSLHKKLNLVYSAFDFILTTEGQYVFLETNPAGEWVWLEKELNIDISKALLKELL